MELLADALAEIHGAIENKAAKPARGPVRRGFSLTPEERARQARQIRQSTARDERGRPLTPAPETPAELNARIVQLDATIRGMLKRLEGALALRREALATVDDVDELRRSLDEHPEQTLEAAQRLHALGQL